MERGEKFEFDGWSLDPNGIEYMDFGKNQYGHDYTRYYFKEPSMSKEGLVDTKEEFERLKEFAAVNGLLRNDDVHFED